MSETTNETTQEEAAQEAGEESTAEEQTGTEEPAASAKSAGFLFPHEAPAEHWNVDFGDGNQVYEGSALPVWILAGWAIFILWAVVYLIFGLPTAF